MCPLDMCSSPLALPVAACLERSQELLEERLQESNNVVGLGCAKLECQIMRTTSGWRSGGRSAPWSPLLLTPHSHSVLWGTAPTPLSMPCFSGCSHVISMFINADTLNCISSFPGTKCNPVPSFASPLPSCCPGNARCFDIITQPTGILSAPLTLL